MKKEDNSKTTYTVGFLRGAVYDSGEEVKRGEVREGVEVNKAAIFQAVNRGRVLGSSKDKKADVAERVKEFEAEIKAEDKALREHADAQIAAGASLANQVKQLQAELATLRKAIP